MRQDQEGGGGCVQTAFKAAVLELRGHHFLCLLTFSGEGYSWSFCANFIRLLNNINSAFQRNESVRIRIVAGPDAICAGERQSHCTAPHITDVRDKNALDWLTMTLCGADAPEGGKLWPWENGRFRAGMEFDLTAAHVAVMREAVKKDLHQGNVYRNLICEGCPHYKMCADCATRHYWDAHLKTSFRQPLVTLG